MYKLSSLLKSGGKNFISLSFGNRTFYLHSLQSYQGWDIDLSVNQRVQILGSSCNEKLADFDQCDPIWK